METIWKVTLSPYFKAKMPIGAKILTIQSQKDSACMWFLCDPEAPKEEREFMAFGTGHILDEEFTEYIGTFQLFEGANVFHVFEKVNK